VERPLQPIEDPASSLGVVAAVFVREPLEAWLTTFKSLRQAEPALRIVAGAANEGTCSSIRASLPWVEVRQVASASHLVDDIRGRERTNILLVWAPTLFPEGALATALQLVEENLRVASVSFLSNIAGVAGFPHSNVINSHQVDNLDEKSITRALRTASFQFGAVPMPYPMGPAVLFSWQGMSLLSRFPDHGKSVWVSIAEYGTNLRTRGMVDLLDPSTFVTRPLDMGDLYPDHAGLGEEEWLWLHHRSPGLLRVSDEPTEQCAPFREALGWAQSEVFGMRVILDGSCLGEKEMGTQVSMLALIQALSDRPEIRYIGVALAGAVPAYASQVLSHPKVEARHAPNGDLSEFQPVDIIHCPFQKPTADIATWRAKARRLVMTIHDLVAFQTPTYFFTPEDWFEYRRSIREWSASVDGVVVVSDDSRAQVQLERLSIEDDRIFAVPNGTKHLNGSEPSLLPEELLARGFAGEEFVLVLGANYSHKNRDVAVRVLEELHTRGFPLHLIMAGALVPFGSSRVAEAEAGLPHEWVIVIPDVASAERNWLLKHAKLVLYPTSAEGFGLVPHEAAAFGTPCVTVPFGPLAERLTGVPVVPPDWAVESLADACLQLLRDPGLANAQVEALVLDDDKYNWPAAAAATVKAYQSLLARPSRSRI
jgi:glycosyltransferase involved in cell wall biosynthesis